MTDQNERPLLRPGLPLEQFTLKLLREDYERLIVPPGVSERDFTRQEIRRAYTAGFGAAMAFARRLERETPERRAQLIQALMQQVDEQALALTDMPRSG